MGFPGKRVGGVFPFIFSGGKVPEFGDNTPPIDGFFLRRRLKTHGTLVEKKFPPRQKILEAGNKTYLLWCLHALLTDSTAVGSRLREGQTLKTL